MRDSPARLGRYIRRSIPRSSYLWHCRRIRMSETDVRGCGSAACHIIVGFRRSGNRSVCRRLPPGRSGIEQIAVGVCCESSFLRRYPVLAEKHVSEAANLLRRVMKPVAAGARVDLTVYRISDRNELKLRGY